MSVELESKLRDFVEIVSDMRDKQREYFDRSRRTETTLRESKRLEARFDDNSPRLF